MEKESKSLGVPAKKRSGSPRVPSPKKATASRRSDPSRAHAHGLSLLERVESLELSITMQAIEVVALGRQRMRWDKLIDLIVELAVEQGTVERSAHATIQTLIDKLDALRDPPALAARSGAKQSPRSGTERKRATQGSGRKAATPKKKG